MALAFQLVRLQDLHGESQKQLEHLETVNFKLPIKNDAVQATIQLFDLQYIVNSRPGEYALGRELVKCEIMSVSGASATVKVSVLLRPRDAGATFAFQTSVTVLVIADLAEHRPLPSTRLTITEVSPHQVEVGGPVNFKGENLGLVDWAFFTDKNGKSVASPARGQDVGRSAVATLPIGLEIGHGTVYLTDADKSESNIKEIDFVRP